MHVIGPDGRFAAAWLAGLGVLAFVLLGLTRAPQDVDPAVGERVDFGTDVRPILVRSCLACHGFDPSTREAGLRLDTFEGATESRDGARGIVPGDADASLVIQRVTATDPHDRMPLDGDPLSEDEVQTLRDWINQGASYELHWSLKPLESVTPPRVAGAWASTSIDAFVAARLADADLTPAPRADRRTLIRRASYDLTGLPPTPDEVREFLEDDSPQAFDRVVDRLLASPRFGERWARHWLDLARYAETYGHEFDYPIRNAWQYRDYVIRAFNADVPYDQFVTEQIAGDLLEQPRRHPTMGFNESIIGTGIWWLSQGTHGPVDVRLDEAERIDNQIDVLSKSFLATTVSCARCHDHKFDPIYTREYYALSGFFQSSRRQDAYLDPHGAIEKAATHMADMHAEARLALEATTRPALLAEATDVAEYLLAAADVMYGTRGPDEPAPADSTITFDTFDDLTYDRWTVEGDAFTDRPTRAGNDPLAAEGTAQGAGFANTHRRLEGEGSVEADRRVGRLISPEFQIARDYLHMHIGGGRHPGKTGLRVLVDGEVVGEATGSNSLRLRQERLDLRTWRGQTARIEIFDDITGGWGNIRVDELVFSDTPNLDRAARRSIDVVADTHDLDPARLTTWVRMLQADVEDASPLSFWLTAAAEAAARPNAVIQRPAPADADVRGEVIETFTDADAYARWYDAGWAFGDAPSRAGTWRTPAGTPRLIETDSADSGAISDRLMGTLRSETFEITHPAIAVRAKGRGVTRVIIDGYTMDEHNALLFEDCRLDINTDHWSWHVHNVDKYVGHRAHIEIIDDRTDASLAVDRIEFIDQVRRPAPRDWRPGGDVRTLADLASAYEAAAVAGLTEQDMFGLAFADVLIARSVWTIPAPGNDAFARLEASCPTPIRVTAMQDGTGEDERIFIRGSHKTLGDVATRSFIDVLCDDPTLDIPRGSGRLQLAEALLDDSNPMPARVMVNRVWKHLMGRGIVESTDDFGLLGAEPTHPYLLDHLATRFRTDMGWSVKALIREIMLSSTYQMASGAPGDVARQLDPNNHLWSVREPKRLEGEAIRDAILQISDRLDTTMYGTSVPIHLSPFMTGRGRPRESGPLDGDGRRSIYLKVRRNFLSPMMSTFDAPNPHMTIGTRSISNVPAQSLILLNDPFVAQQAGRLATNLESIDDVDDRLDRLFMLALSRPPTGDERVASKSFLDESGAGHEAWADLSHVVFNMKEFIFIE